MRQHLSQEEDQLEVGVEEEDAEEEEAAVKEGREDDGIHDIHEEPDEIRDGLGEDPDPDDNDVYEEALDYVEDADARPRDAAARARRGGPHPRRPHP